MARIQGLVESGCLKASQLLKTGVGYVFSISIGWVGCTAGQYPTLRDGVDASAKPIIPFPFATTNGFIHKEWPQGKKFDTGLFYDEGAGGGGGGSQIWVEITYK